MPLKARLSQSNIDLTQFNDLRYSLGSFDCLTFTNMVWKQLYGFEYSPQWLGRYSELTTADELKSIFRFDTLGEGLSSVLQQTDGFPYGSLVVFNNPTAKPLGASLGICLGSQSVFVALKGVIKLPTVICNSSWINKC